MIKLLDLDAAAHEISDVLEVGLASLPELCEDAGLCFDSLREMARQLGLDPEPVIALSLMVARCARDDRVQLCYDVLGRRN